MMRFRRADPVTREQIEWLALAGAIAATVFALGLVVFDHLSSGGADLVIRRTLVYTALRSDANWRKW